MSRAFPLLLLALLFGCDTTQEETVELPEVEAEQPFNGVISATINGEPWSDSLRVTGSLSVDPVSGFTLRTSVPYVPPEGYSRYYWTRLNFYLGPDLAGEHDLTLRSVRVGDKETLRGATASEGHGDGVHGFYDAVGEFEQTLTLEPGDGSQSYRGTFRATLIIPDPKWNRSNRVLPDTLRFENGEVRFTAIDENAE